MSVTLLAFTELLPAEMRARATAFAETISRRRTVRGFSDRPVPRDIIAECVRAAASAPGGANLQPRHFVVIGDPAIKRRLRFAAEAAEREFYSGRSPDAWLAALAHLGTGPDKPFRETAPWLIAVLAQYSVVDPQGSPHPICYPKEYVGIACCLLIAAFHDAGLATPTHAPSPMHFLNNIPGHPATEKPFLLLVTGFPAPGATVPTMALQKKSPAEIATWISSAARKPAGISVCRRATIRPDRPSPLLRAPASTLSFFRARHPQR